MNSNMITNSDFIMTEDSHRIAYDHYVKGNDKVIAIVHGFYNSKESELLIGLTKHLLSSGHDVMIFDLRGHGRSPGLFTWTSKEGKDLEAVLTYLNGKYSKIGVIGFSMGGSIAINVLASGKFKVDSLICVSSPSDQAKVDYKWWKLSLENDIYYSLLTLNGRRGKGVRPGWPWHKKERPIDSAANLKMPVLFIHGDRDWVVGKWHSEQLFDKVVTRKSIKVIVGGSHAEYLLRHKKDEFLKETDLWFSSTLQRKEGK